MEDLLCPQCSMPLPQRGYFCPNCSAPTKCRMCGSVLEPWAKACVECGTRIEGGEVGGSSSSLQSHVPLINTIKFEETRNHRALEASFTDTAVGNLSDPLAAFFASGIRQPATKPNNQAAKHLPFVDDGQAALGDGVSSAGSTIVDVVPATPPDHQTADSDKVRLEEIFRIEGEELKLIELDLKASSQKDFVLRLSCLFLYAHEVFGRSTVPRSSLNEVLRTHSVYDSNATSAINNSIDIVKDGDELSPSRSGRVAAKNVLGEVFDESVVATWQLGSRARKRSQGASPTEEGPAPPRARTAKRSPGSSKIIQDWTKKWKDQFGEVKAHQILKSRSVEDTGAFALWAISKVTNNSVSEVTRRQLADFVHTAFDLKVNDRTLENQLKKSSKVVHVSGTKFRLNPEGHTFVENLTRE